MKPIVKRSIAAAVAIALGAAIQWVSGTPFTRSPDEAAFLITAIFFAGIVAACPGFGE